MYLKSKQGFFLHDTLLALSCLLTLGIFILPVVQKIYNDNYDMQLQLDAYVFLQEQMEVLIDYSHSNQIHSLPSPYDLTVDYFDQKWFICITWLPSNTVEKRICRYVHPSD